MTDITFKSRVNEYGVLHDYILINPSLESPEYYRQYIMSEIDRQLLTKYRSGSHHLKVNTGYFQRTPMESRVCRCNQLQTLEHVLFYCQLTEPLRHNFFPLNLKEFFEDTNLATIKIRAMETILRIRRY